MPLHSSCIVPDDCGNVNEKVVFQATLFISSFLSKMRNVILLINMNTCEMLEINIAYFDIY